MSFLYVATPGGDQQLYGRGEKDQRNEGEGYGDQLTEGKCDHDGESREVDQHARDSEQTDSQPFAEKDVAPENGIHQEWEQRAALTLARDGIHGDIHAT